METCLSNILCLTHQTLAFNIRTKRYRSTVYNLSALPACLSAGKFFFFTVCVLLAWWTSIGCSNLRRTTTSQWFKMLNRNACKLPGGCHHHLGQASKPSTRSSVLIGLIGQASQSKFGLDSQLAVDSSSSAQESKAFSVSYLPPCTGLLESRRFSMIQKAK